MAYLSSKKVKVFPSAFRGKDSENKQINPQSFLTLEENYINIANKITNRLEDYFFIDGDNVIIVLHGYCFIAETNDILGLFASPEDEQEIWVGASTGALPMTSYNNENTPVLVPNGGSAGESLDNSGEFKALMFGSESDVNGCNYKIGLFKYSDSSWKPIEKYTFNIETSQIKDTSDNSIDKQFTTDFVHTSSVKTPSIVGEDNLTISASTFSVSANKSIYLYASSSVSLHGNTINLSTYSSSGAGNVEIYAKGIIDLKQNTEIKGNFIPKSNNSYNLGSANSYFKSAFISSITASYIYATNISVGGNVSAAGVSTDSVNASFSVNAQSVYADRFEVKNASTGMIITNYLYAKDTSRKLLIGDVQGRADVDIRASSLLLETSSDVFVNGNIIPISKPNAVIGTNTVPWYEGHFSNVYAGNVSISTLAVGVVSGNVVPKSQSIYTLGDDTYTWQSAYINGLYTGYITPNGNSDLCIEQPLGSCLLELSARGQIYMTASNGLRIETSYGPINIEAGSYYASGNYYTQNFNLGASDVSVVANHISLGAYASHTYLTKDSVGNAYTPIYLSSGRPTECNVSGGGEITSTSNVSIQIQKYAADTQGVHSASDYIDLDYTQNKIYWSWIRIGNIMKVSMRIVCNITDNTGPNVFPGPWFDELKFRRVKLQDLINKAGFTDKKANLDGCTCVASGMKYAVNKMSSPISTASLAYAYGGNSHLVTWIGVDDYVYVYLAQSDDYTKGMSFEITIPLINK